MSTIEYLLEKTNLCVEDIAQQSGLSEARVEAIAMGRWLPSPAEREAMAKVFGVSVDEISWGHTMNPRNVRYRRFGLKENF